MPANMESKQRKFVRKLKCSLVNITWEFKLSVTLISDRFKVLKEINYTLYCSIIAFKFSPLCEEGLNLIALRHNSTSFPIRLKETEKTTQEILDLIDHVCYKNELRFHFDLERLGFSDTSELGSRLGDNDPAIHPLPSERSEDTDSQIEEIKLHIPDLEQVEHEESVKEQSEQNDTQFLEHLLDVDNIENGHLRNEKEQSTKFIDVQREPIIQTNNVTSKNYLKDKIRYSQGKRPHEKTVYVVRTVPQPSNKYIGRETNVTAVLNKPVITPFVENPYFRIDSGYSSRPHTYSGNSIKRLNRDKTTNNNKMSYRTREIYNYGNMGNVSGNMGNMQSMGTVTSMGSVGNMGNITSMSRVQEKEELQRLNDRFSAYVTKVRQMSDSNFQDSGAFIKSAKILEEEVMNLKNLYERELEAIRQQLEAVTRERNSFQCQFSKNQQTAADMQDRDYMSIENMNPMM
ncbi:hypothetical protein KUTeg_023391 [Tegillarca granosa]|uniref:IF rod domain-containing protein n=1 Tax=Tegillarca granosa TaxID=220873 RepID=A0ABQ9E1I4_TEGGR|nr:hypothetical protein KUTeg_023391 [Tegillarca granosa]